MKKTLIKKIEHINQSADGVYAYNQLLDSGVSPSSIQRAVKRGELERVARGVYRIPEYMDDEIYNAQLNRSQLVYSHDTALYLHDLCDRYPINYSVTVPTGYNTKQLRKEGFKVFIIAIDIHGQDIIELKTEYGNYIRTYNAERTICDCLKNRNKLQSEIVFSGLKRYVRKSDRNLGMLMQIADKIGIAPLLRTYLEVLV